MNIKALVAVKEKSVRVENKNIRPFFGSNILELKIRQLKRIFNDRDIVVNSESDKLLEIAERYNVTTIKRDEKYTKSDIPMSEVFKNMAENIDTDVIAYANTTSPLIKDETISNTLNVFRHGFKNGEIDSLVTCRDVKEFLWLDNKPINYDTKIQPRSQDLPEIVALAFAVSIIPRELMIEYKNIIGKKPYFYKLNEIESLDIDTPLDFFIAERVYELRSLER